MTAFNYATQEWAEGREGAAILAESLRDELAILTGPRGLDYHRATTKPTTQHAGCTLAERIADARAMLAQAEAELAGVA